ncbi:MAG: hypothetical protein IBJ00_01310 [Alphaproteobacteria bacterium]|nr:hypothetical protein [Alphaproteobacteria bacterium]
MIGSDGYVHKKIPPFIHIVGYNAPEEHFMLRSSFDGRPTALEVPTAGNVEWELNEVILVKARDLLI